MSGTGSCVLTGANVYAKRCYVTVILTANLITQMRIAVSTH